MFKSTLLFSFLTMTSRILGFVRDVLFANYFGTTPIADAINVAFKLPNFFRSVFAEGAFAISFIPEFSKLAARGGRTVALRFASQLLAVLIVCVICFVLLLQAFMPSVIGVLAPGFALDPEQMRISMKLCYIATPYLILISIVTFYASALNSIDKFAAMSFAPVVLNAALIASLLMCHMGDEHAAVIMTASSLVAGFIQLGIVMWSANRHGLLCVPHWPRSFAVSIKPFCNSLCPALLTSGASQVGLWVGTMLASTIPGAISLIYLTDRLIQLPVSIVGVSIATVLLPYVSRCVRNSELASAHAKQNQAFTSSMILSVPAMISLVVLGERIITVLFQRGNFSAQDTQHAVPILAFFALGLPAYVLNKILSNIFFAHQMASVTLRASVVSIAVNILLNLLLLKDLGASSIALSTAIAAWINTGTLWVHGVRRGLIGAVGQMGWKVLRVALCNTLFALMLRYSNNWIDGSYGPVHLASHVTIALITYAVLAYATGLVSLPRRKK